MSWVKWKRPMSQISEIGCTLHKIFIMIWFWYIFTGLCVIRRNTLGNNIQSHLYFFHLYLTIFNWHFPIYDIRHFWCMYVFHDCDCESQQKRLGFDRKNAKLTSCIWLSILLSFASIIVLHRHFALYMCGCKHLQN